MNRYLLFVLLACFTFTSCVKKARKAVEEKDSFFYQPHVWKFTTKSNGNSTSYFDTLSIGYIDGIRASWPGTNICSAAIFQVDEANSDSKKLVQLTSDYGTVIVNLYYDSKAEQLRLSQLSKPNQSPFGGVIGYTLTIYGETQ